MKTIDFLRMIKEKNLLFPNDWAIVQSSSGQIKDIMVPREKNDLRMKQAEKMKEKLMKLIK